MAAHYRTRMARGERGVVVPERTRPAPGRRLSDYAAPAASKLGITVEEYRAHVAAGEKWCSGHQAWHPATTDVFPRSRGTRDGFGGNCKVWMRAYTRERGRAS